MVAHYCALPRVKIIVAAMEGGRESEAQHLHPRKVLRWKNNEQRTSNSGLRSGGDCDMRLQGARRTAATPPTKLEMGDVTWGVVLTLLSWKWSPQQIAAALKCVYPDQPDPRSHETIYTAIYDQPRGELRRQLIACLRQGRSTRMPRSRGRDRRGQIPDMVSTHVRPPEVDVRRPASTRRNGPCRRARPAGFLFDEPLSNLDAKLRVAMRAEIRELHQRLKATTVYVTHDQIEAMTMADKIVAMHDGIVEQVGTPLELFDRPRNVFVAAFIGSPSMNLLPVKTNGLGVVDSAGNQWSVSHVPATSGQALTLGVRPEHLRLDEAGVEASVLVVESTGSETHLLVDAGGIKLTCVLRERVSVRPGDHVRLGSDNAHLHLFRADSGERLEPGH